MGIEEFETIVEETLTELPQEFTEALDNVAVMVEEWPTPDDLQAAGISENSLLFGLYKGIPLTKRSSNYTGVLPDKITLYKGSILQVHQDKESIKKQIKSTVLHELGHYFGLDEEAIRKAQENI